MTELTGREIFLNKLWPFVLEREIGLIETAYIFSKYGHRGQRRDQGERYFEHPRSVAEIIIDELGIKDNWEIIATALLHDMLEDSYLLNEERIVINFGREVALWVKMLTKKPKDGYISRLMNFAPWQVLVVKLADRLHNLRTLGDCTQQKQVKQIIETREDYFPLCERLIDILPDDKKQIGRKLKKKLRRACDHFEKKFMAQTAE